MESGLITPTFKLKRPQARGADFCQGTRVPCSAEAKRKGVTLSRKRALTAVVFPNIILQAKAFFKDAIDSMYATLSARGEA